ncbi:MAG: transcription termination factor NusA [Candidatus Taylorbacteria bacterium RIFCSPLOWO2_12_FULL_47_20]|uniref:Transcription termination/antitermination protein NusA n=2 Tax=Candidatus Tayloriibacteriota TaxID=1817919 RepID=A0A1G2P866_9BACT|nr:MAG: transcription termination factor NusA [Candidatus Taylorbacteria bacterium RIFCSPLOWO2_02_FULL_46_40]OHA44510.1 MAG: transcription termination factor NusA [Candidatus Taylorbacteria bacterium RIFCSPLOWO2_12_FULL_47_20]
MFDLKTINLILNQLEEERGIPKAKVLEAIEMALATAYRKEYGKKGQIVRAKFDISTGQTEYFQVKIVVDRNDVIMPEDIPESGERTPEMEEKIRFNPEHHMLLDDAKKIKKDANVDDEIIFSLETQTNFGRIAAQTAKQIIIQKIREAEKVSVFEEFGKREGEIISGTVQRIERGTVFIDLGRATGTLPYEDQIPGERFKQGERIRAYLNKVEETPRGVFLRVSRSHPKFLEKLFAVEAPEIASGTVEIKAVAREPGSRSKIAVTSHDAHIDPVGSMVGQRGVRVSTVMSELGGEKIDIIQWSEDPARFVEASLSPAQTLGVKIDEKENKAVVEVAEDQQSLAIGKGGQNVRLAAKLTGWKIDIRSAVGQEVVAVASEETKAPKTETAPAEPAEKAESGAVEETAPPVTEEPGTKEAKEKTEEVSEKPKTEESVEKKKKRKAKKTDVV